MKVRIHTLLYHYLSQYLLLHINIITSGLAPGCHLSVLLPERREASKLIAGYGKIFAFFLFCQTGTVRPLVNVVDSNQFHLYQHLRL